MKSLISQLKNNENPNTLGYNPFSVKDFGTMLLSSSNNSPRIGIKSTDSGLLDFEESLKRNNVSFTKEVDEETKTIWYSCKSNPPIITVTNKVKRGSNYTPPKKKKK